MKILHITHSYSLVDVKEQDIYSVRKGFSDYKRFFDFLKNKTFDVVHIHTVGEETFGIYAGIARMYKIKVIRTLHAPILFSYFYTVKQMCARFFYSHTVCTSKYDLLQVDRFHIVLKSQRNLIYKGVDQKKKEDSISKDSARSYIYKKMGISFAKRIRIIGSIIGDNKNNGVEHLVDAAYLADKYKNLTNTIFIILVRGLISDDIKEQIEELHISGIFFIIEEVENPEEYIQAFDIYISPRTDTGDLYTLLLALYMGVPCIATKVGDTQEFETYATAPLVPPSSAKFLTEAIMFEIKREKPLTFKVVDTTSGFPKKFTKDQEKLMLREVYTRIIGRLKSVKSR